MEIILGDIARAQRREDIANQNASEAIARLKAELAQSQRREATANQNTAEATEQYLKAEAEIKSLEIQVFESKVEAERLRRTLEMRTFDLESGIASQATEIAGLRELCQRQDQDIQRLSRWRDRWKAVAKSMFRGDPIEKRIPDEGQDDWPIEYDPETLKEVSAEALLRVERNQAAELVRERDHYEDRCEQLYLKVAELEAQRDELLEALVLLTEATCLVHARDGSGLWLEPDGYPSREGAIALLVKLGRARKLRPGRYELTWPK